MVKVRSHPLSRVALAALAALVLSALAPAALAAQYKVVPLPVPSAYTNPEAYRINNLGEIYGSATLTATGANVRLLWPDAYSDPIPLPGSASGSGGFDDQRRTLDGYTIRLPDNTLVPFPRTPIALAHNGTILFSNGPALLPNGTTGTYPSVNGIGSPVLSPNGRFVGGFLPGPTSNPPVPVTLGTAIPTLGQLNRPALTLPFTAIPSSGSRFTSITDDGLYAGTFIPYPPAGTLGPVKPFASVNGVPTVLPIGSYNAGYTTAITPDGTVYGFVTPTGSGPTIPVTWINGELTPLDTLVTNLEPGQRVSVTHTNASGHLLASVLTSSPTRLTPALLVPLPQIVPEPSTALLLSPLLLLATRRRHL